MKLHDIEGNFSVCKIDHIGQVDFTREFVFLSKTENLKQTIQALTNNGYTIK